MRCKKAEKMLLRSVDHPLGKDVKLELEKHLASCPGCRAIKQDYQVIFSAFKEDPVPEMKPFFWQRLKPQLEQKTHPKPLILWKGLGLKNISFVFMILLLIFTAMALLLPQNPSLIEREELSQTEVFLLREANPFQETQSLFEQEDSANKNITLIFAELDDQTNNRRDFP
jgi:hypothetical protein